MNPTDKATLRSTSDRRKLAALLATRGFTSQSLEAGIVSELIEALKEADIAITALREFHEPRFGRVGCQEPRHAIVRAALAKLEDAKSPAFKSAA